MEFGNPIVGAEDLIREAIKSPNFNTDPESGNVTGWRIARDGSATFYNLTIGSENYNIDENGNAVFQTVSADDIFLNGESLNDLFAQSPSGVLGVTTSTSDLSLVNAGVDQIFNKIDIPDFDATRQYRIGFIARFNVVRDGSNPGPNFIRTRCTFEWNGDAGASSPTLFEIQDSRGEAGSDTVMTGIHVINNPDHNGDTLSLAFIMDHGGGTNAQVQYQGTSYGRVWYEDCGPLVVYGSFTPDVPPVQQYTKTYNSTNSNAFQSDGDNRGTTELYQGYYSGTNGNQFSLIAFDDAQIRSDLSGATIIKVELYLQNRHFYQNSGGDALIGTHNQSSVSGDHSVSQVLDDRMTTPHYDKGQARWVTLPNSFGENLRDNTRKGVALGPASSNSNADYGYFDGLGQSGNPRLRITYSK